jgi:hypothetical protein
MTRIPGDLTDRAVSETMGTIFLAAVVIVVSATVGVFVLDVANDVGDDVDVPQSSFEADYRNGQVVFRHQGGDPISTDELRIEGPGGPTRSFAQGTLTAGNAVGYAALPGETVSLVWERGEESILLREYTVPEGASAPSRSVAWDASAGSNASEFLVLFNEDALGTDDPRPVDGGRNKCGTTDGIGWTSPGGRDRTQASRYERAAPVNTGTIEINVTVQGCSIDDPRQGVDGGAKIYAVDTGGTEHVLLCDESTDSLDGGEGVSIGCPGGEKNELRTGKGRVTISETVTADTGRIETIVFVQDTEGQRGRDEIRLYEFRVDAA